MSNLRDIGEVDPLVVWDGVIGRWIEGERITLAVVELEPGAQVPLHSHPHEQVGIMLQGSGRFRVGDEERDMRAGSTWRVLANVPHGLSAGPEGAVVIDTFSPPREDWAGLSPADGHVSRWPSDRDRPAVAID